MWTQERKFSRQLEASPQCISCGFPRRGRPCGNTRACIMGMPSLGAGQGGGLPQWGYPLEKLLSKLPPLTRGTGLVSEQLAAAWGLIVNPGGGGLEEGQSLHSQSPATSCGQGNVWAQISRATDPAQFSTCGTGGGQLLHTPRAALGTPMCLLLLLWECIFGPWVCSQTRNQNLQARARSFGFSLRAACPDLDTFRAAPTQHRLSPILREEMVCVPGWLCIPEVLFSQCTCACGIWTSGVKG